MSSHILIVDDDPQIRSVLRIALKQAGMQISEAGDGAEGLAKARSGRFDLVVLDIGLPEMDGLEVCRALRAGDQTPVLFLTARDDEIDRVLGFELGGTTMSPNRSRRVNLLRGSRRSSSAAADTLTR
ncbi:response regulator [Sulfitobacter aestuariivivens]|uniref:response regulator n=1 Tax=Sulfitobacter aestuariivivens TaxID=2766981 RepID=UPI0036156893